MHCFMVMTFKLVKKHIPDMNLPPNLHIKTLISSFLTIGLPLKSLTREFTIQNM